MEAFMNLLRALTMQKTMNAMIREVDDCTDKRTKVNAVLGARNWNRKTRNPVPPARDQLNKWADDAIDKEVTQR